MEASANVPVLWSIFRQLCPRCRTGRIFRSSIFRGYPEIHEYCPTCGLKFEREEGYFLGAMYISYGLALVTIAAFAALLWVLTNWPLEKIVIGAILPFVPLTPTISRFSRVLWIYFDRSVFPE